MFVKTTPPWEFNMDPGNDDWLKESPFRYRTLLVSMLNPSGQSNITNGKSTIAITQSMYFKFLSIPCLENPTCFSACYPYQNLV